MKKPQDPRLKDPRVKVVSEHDGIQMVSVELKTKRTNTTNEPDFIGFDDEMHERNELGLPICRDTLIEMAERYKTPIPGTPEWEKFMAEISDQPKS